MFKRIQPLTVSIKTRLRKRILKIALAVQTDLFRRRKPESIPRCHWHTRHAKLKLPQIQIPCLCPPWELFVSARQKQTWQRT